MLRRLLPLLLVGCALEAPPPVAPVAPVAPPPPPAVLADLPPLPPLPAVVTPAPAPAPAPAAVSAAAPIPAPTGAGPDTLLATIFGGGSSTLKAIVATPQKYRFQAVYSVVRGATLERHAYRADAEYYYPASSMKVPITLAAYNRLSALRSAGKPGLTRDATLHIHPVTGNAEPYVTSLSRETWRALIVSDNVSANRLLGFVGHREVHENLWALGLASARVHAGFATGADIDPAELSPAIDVMVAGGAAEQIPARKSDLKLPATNATSLGVGTSVLDNGRVVPGPLSFADKNAMRITDLQDALVRIMRPDLLPKAPSGDTASKEDMDYVRQALGTLPSESGLAGYDRNVVADYQLIPFLRGLERVRARGHFEIHSKVGQAYGFLIGNAYIVDKDTGRAFFLTAAIYANPNEIMNDDKYAYDTVSFPALADLAEVVTRHALSAP